MPKVVDYASRYEFLREAAFAVVLDDGPATLSRQALADTLGIALTTVRRLVAPTTSLSGMAAQAVERRRAHGRWGIPRGDDRRWNAVRLLRSVLPETDERIDEELVWLRLVLLHPRPADANARCHARARYEMYDHGWAVPPEPGAAKDDPAVARSIAERESFVRDRLSRVLDELEVPSEARTSTLRLLRVLVDGLTMDIVLGHLTPAEALELVDDLTQCPTTWGLSRVEE